MAITPYNTPIMTEYKPLGLEAFAQPLSQMQQQFDTTQNELAKTEFDLKHLPLGTDPERAKALIKIAEEKRNEIAKNLMSSKNYRQAGKQLLELRNLWEKDPEKQVLESNYANYQNLIKEERERLKSGKIDQKDFNQWLNKLNRTYGTELGGASFKASFDNPDGSYNTPGLKARVDNKAKEVREMSLKIASMSADQKRDYFTSAGFDMDLNDKKFVKTVIEEKDPKKVAANIEAYLKQQPDFVEWASESANYNLDEIKHSDPKQYRNTADNLLLNRQKDIAGYMRDIIAQTRSKNPATAERAKKIKDSEAFQTMSKEIEDLGQLRESGKYSDDLINRLYEDQHINRVFDGTTLGKVVGYKNITHDWTFRDMPNPDDGGGSGGNGKDPQFALLANKDMQFNVGDIKTRINQSKSSMYGIVKKVNDLGDGVVRKLIMGSGDQREKLSKNSMAIYERQNKLKEALLQSIDPKTGKANYDIFKNNLKKSGINGDDQLTKNIFTKLNDPNSGFLRAFDENLAQGENLYTQFKTSKSNYSTLKILARNSEEAKTVFSEVGQSIPSNVNLDSFAYKNMSDKDRKQAIERQKLFMPTSYTEEQLKKVGFVPDKNRKYFQHDALNADQVAKLQGYKNAYEAIKKGYDFKGAKFATAYDVSSGKFEKNSFFPGMSGTTTELLATITAHKAKTGLSSNKMSYSLINEPETEAILKKNFNNIQTLLSYSGADKKNFANLPGFDEEGNAKPGTKISSSTTPHLVFHGNNIYYQVDVETADGDTHLTIAPKEGDKPALLHYLNRMTRKIENAKSNKNGVVPYDELKLQTFNAAKFNLQYGDVANDVIAKSPAYQVNKANPAVVVGNFRMADGYGIGKSVSIIKGVDSSTNQEYYYVKDASKNPSYTGEPKFDSIEAIKAELGSTIE